MPCFTDTLTTAFWMERLQPVFPFTTFLLQPFAKQQNLIELSNCRASAAADANRLQIFLSYNPPFFYISAALCRRNASNSFQRVKDHFRKRNLNRMRI